MNKKIFITMLLLIMMISSNGIYAQLTMEKIGTEITIPNSQTYNFIKYGNVGASLYTGTVNYSVPVYTYKDKDFEIPISLDYASNGFLPNQRAGDVGLDWVLNIGGVITREIRGIPDEQEYQYNDVRIGFRRIFFDNISITDLTEHGLKNQKDTFSLSFFTNTSNINDRSICATANSRTDCCETTPDIYHFNFMGYQGSFHLWFDNKIILYNTNTKESLKIKLYENGPSNMNFTITTGSGYIYSFIASDYSQERRLDSESVEHESKSWKLTTITAPNGRTVTFQYGNYVFGNRGFLYQYQPASTYTYLNLSAPNSSALVHESPMPFVQSGLRTWPITKVYISNGPTIWFEYKSTEGEKRIVPPNAQMTENVTKSSPKLEKIYTLNGSDTLSRCKLIYKTSTINPSYNNGLRNSVYFLGSIDIKGEGKYEFEYNHRELGGFPCLGTYSVDHWGYYNGANNGTNIINFLNQITYDNSNHTEFINTNIRNSDTTYAAMGLLKKVTYPTGGYSLLEYQPHSYSKKVVRNSTNEYIPALANLQSNYYDVGGLRIYSVSDYNTDNTIRNKRKYIYEVDGLSTGTLLNSPRYGVSYSANYMNYPKIFKYISLYDVYSYNRTHIEYRKVIEQLNDTSKVEYDFTNYEDFPDLCNLFDTSHIPLPTGDYLYPINSGANYVRNILTPMSSEQAMRGKLKLKTIKSSSGSILRQETLNYSHFDEFIYNIPTAVGEDIRWVGIKDFNSIQTTSIQTDYSSGGNISTLKKLGYNSKGQISRISTLDSKGDSLITKYTYVTDLPSYQITSGSVYKAMLDSNVISYPLKEELYLKKPGYSEVLLSGKQYTYVNPVSSNKRIVKIAKVELYDKANSSWYTDIEYTQFDNKGNVLESKDKNGLYSCYVWGYNGLYLVAKVEGELSLNNLKSAISGLSNISTSPLTGAMISGAQNTLKTSWPSVKMTVFEYIPFVGLSKIIDPSGKVTEYQYNASGKLKGIKDGNNQLHNEYFYSPDNKL